MLTLKLFFVNILTYTYVYCNNMIWIKKTDKNILLERHRLSDACKIFKA